jgi:hypothetical protein
MRSGRAGEVAVTTYAKSANAIQPIGGGMEREAMTQGKNTRALHDGPQAESLQVDAPFVGLDAPEEPNRRLGCSRRLCKKQQKW